MISFMKLMIVESPAKAKTIEKYLGKDFKVLASYGHIRDLVSKDGSVDPDRDFAMKWHIDSVGNKHIAAIEKAIKTADEVFLATDPDREGEAISWHLVEILKDKLHVPVKRVVFHEITKSAVTKAISDPRGLDINLVEAYLARRALDYLVGFKLSPILWRKLPKSKSAGRVQSVALRLIYERECEIDKFKSEEYWDVVGNFSSKKGGLSARLITFDGKKLEKLSIKNELEAKKIKDSLLHEQYAIASIDRKVTYRKPFAPFITSTLQQEASRKLGFSARNTMSLAQRLYEGVVINGEQTGLITYMRTDSVNLSDEALSGIRAFISNVYTNDYLPKTSIKYSSKVKNAQEAHEAIRPSRFDLPPSKIKGQIDDNLYALYDLIWKRTIASQMTNAKFNQVIIDMANDVSSATFRASGSTLVFDGFLKVYDESLDEAVKNDQNDSDKQLLPDLNENDTVATDELDEFSDNDTLSAYVADLTDSDALIILSDIDGLYTSDPNKNPDAEIIDTVTAIDDSIYRIAGGSSSALGTGGMATKVRAADMLCSRGIDMVIAQGENPEIIFDILDGKKVGTMFVASL